MLAFIDEAWGLANPNRERGDGKNKKYKLVVGI
jgi:hypothetical protein